MITKNDTGSRPGNDTRPKRYTWEGCDYYLQTSQRQTCLLPEPLRPTEIELPRHTRHLGFRVLGNVGGICILPDSNPRPPTTQTCWCGRRQTGEFRGIMVGFSWAVAPLSASVASLLASVASLSASLPPLIFAVPVGFRPAPTGPAAIPRAHRTPMWQPAPSPPASRINFWPYL